MVYKHQQHRPCTRKGHHREYYYGIGKPILASDLPRVENIGGCGTLSQKRHGDGGRRNLLVRKMALIKSAMGYIRYTGRKTEGFDRGGKGGRDTGKNPM